MLHQPVLTLVGKLISEYPGRPVTVLLPELVKPHWYQQLVHTRRAALLRAKLLQRGCGNVSVIVVPWHLKTDE